MLVLAAEVFSEEGMGGRVLQAAEMERVSELLEAAKCFLRVVARPG
jgi:hypothetical protein